MELSGKVALVTGASRGIGRALAFELSHSDCKLILTGLEGDELCAVVEELKDRQRASVEAMPADLTDPFTRQSFFEWIGSLADKPDILINNAGGGRFGRFDTSDQDEIEQTLTLNIHASTILTRKLIPILKTRPEAKIVNISSGIARLPYPGLAVYGACKGYVTSFSESLACELIGTNISVLCFYPGFTETRFMDSAGMDMHGVPGFMIRTPEQVAARIVRAIRKDKARAYSDISGRLGAVFAAMLPQKARIRLFRNMFWRLPDED